MWTDSRYLAQADAELDCEWKIFDIGQNIGIADWLDVSFIHNFKNTNLFIFQFTVRTTTRLKNWS